MLLDVAGVQRRLPDAPRRPLLHVPVQLPVAPRVVLLRELARLVASEQPHLVGGEQRQREDLGAQIVGAEASMIIQPLIQAMAFDQPADEVARGQYWIHPALPEVIENALLGLEFTPR